MRPILENYIKLEKSEVLRAKKVEAMKGLLAAFDTEAALSLSEIKALTQATDIRQPVFEKLIYPVLEAGVDGGNINAIKIMIELIQHVYTYQSRHRQWRYDLADLIGAGLAINPSEPALLNWKYESAVRSLLFSIHEVPWCVLHGNESASESKCQQLLEYTNEFERLGKALLKDDTELLAECRYYYRSFAAYLAARESYLNFANYLELHPQ